ncbi:TPA_asm: UL14 uORF 1 [Human alphaherpesvirus 1]|nr:TPA_asm: UL14 uORF 1 [Human alphaherpesvirus 1]
MERPDARDHGLVALGGRGREI